MSIKSTITNTLYAATLIICAIIHKWLEGPEIKEQSKEEKAKRKRERKRVLKAS